MPTVRPLLQDLMDPKKGPRIRKIKEQRSRHLWRPEFDDDFTCSGWGESAPISTPRRRSRCCAIISSMAQKFRADAF
uniref:Uncharacterized protein n=1 Tax=Macrostomum lignano TaxID=282301 RepID=A0A1I8F6J7_9PLAT